MRTIRGGGRSGVRLDVVGPDLTCAATEPVSAVHYRMPLFLEPAKWEAWLDPAATVADLRPLITPPPAGLLEVVRVGPAVNKAGNEGPECLTPAA